tara:strand:- start:1607 stop:2749 length:1143 start_codon:yes stop_codon:yes gene_type:complete
MINIGYNRQHIDNDDIKRVIKILKSDYITQGKTSEKFESLIKKKFNSKYCKVVSSGTSALYNLIKSINFKKKDIIATTPISFVATSNCIVNAGLTPHFVDIENNFYNIDPNILEDDIRSKKNIRAVIVVDYAGHPADWEALNYLKNKYDLILINDNCHSIGSKLNGRIDYAMKYAQHAVHSYHAVKNITTGEGGALLTNDKKIYEKFNTLSNHGIVKDKKKISEYPWYYELNEIGNNSRITDFQCALGISQLKKLNKFINQRRRLALFYKKYLHETENIKIPIESKSVKHSYHLYPVMINFKKTKTTKSKLFNQMSKHGVNLQVHYIPIYKHPYYVKNYNFKKLHNAESFYKKQVSLPLFYSLDENKIRNISHKLKKLFK